MGMPERIWREGSLEDFKGVLDYPLLRQLEAESQETKFHENVEELAFGWKCCAASTQIVHLLMGAFDRVFDNFYAVKIPMLEQLMDDFRDHIVGVLKLTPVQEHKLQQKLDMFNQRRRDPNAGEPQRAAEALYTAIRDETEMAVAVRGAVQNAYADAFNKFEYFQGKCLEKLGRSATQWYKASDAPKEFKKYCPALEGIFRDHEFIKAGHVRRSITHRMGKLTEELKELKFPAEGEDIIVAVSDLKALFQLIQTMAVKMMPPLIAQP